MTELVRERIRIKLKQALESDEKRSREHVRESLQLLDAMEVQ